MRTGNRASTAYGLAIHSGTGDKNLLWVPNHLVSSKQRTRCGDIVMCTSSGSSAVVVKSAHLRQEWNGTIGAFCVIIRTKSASCDPEFLAFYLKCADFRQWTKQAPGANIKNIRKSDLENFDVPLPKFNEQRRIIKILNHAARIEWLRARALERLQEFIPALFINMFGNPAENPMGWNKYPFLDLVSDNTRKCIKIQKRDYQARGLVQIIDQGKSQVGGYIDRTKGAFSGSFPTVVFGDHTRRFKLIEEPFFLGADGAKLLEPKTALLDPTFLFGQCQALDIIDAGYSRHFRFLKMKELILPPIELQLRYTKAVQTVRAALSVAESGSRTISALNASLMNLLLEAGE